MLSAYQMSQADQRFRQMAAVLELDGGDAGLGKVKRACDFVRVAARAPEWSTEHWLHKAMVAAREAYDSDPRFREFYEDLRTLVTCHVGMEVS